LHGPPRREKAFKCGGMEGRGELLLLGLDLRNGRDCKLKDSEFLVHGGTVLNKIINDQPTVFEHKD